MPSDSVPNSICLLRLSALGDATHVLPIVHTLRKHWPDTRLTWIIGKAERALMDGLPGVDFVVFDKSLGWRAYLDLRHQLAGQSFDVLLSMQLAMRANLASCFVKAPVKIGYDRQRSREFHSCFINRRIEARAGQHVLDSFFGFLAAMGLHEKELSWEIPVPQEASAFAKGHIEDGQQTLLIAPAASKAVRNWTPERYAAVADYAARGRGMKVVLGGGPSDAELRLGQQIEQLMEAAPLNLIGKTSIKQFLALVKQSTALLGPDSGPAHIATCVGTPAIGLYATSPASRTGPYQSRQWTVDAYAEAASAFLDASPEDLPWRTKIDRPGVMDLIAVEAVKEKLDTLLAHIDAS